MVDFNRFIQETFIYPYFTAVYTNNTQTAVCVNTQITPR